MKQARVLIAIGLILFIFFGTVASAQEVRRHCLIGTSPLPDNPGSKTCYSSTTACQNALVSAEASDTVTLYSCVLEVDPGTEVSQEVLDASADLREQIGEARRNAAEGNSESNANQESIYYPLADLPGINAESASDVGTYVNAFFRLAIGIGSVLAVLMIVVGGFQYLSTDNFGAKGAGKERINNALIGLGILLTSVLLLSTINSELLDVSPELTQATSTAALPSGPSEGSFAKAIQDVLAGVRGIVGAGAASATQQEVYAALLPFEEELGVPAAAVTAILQNETRYGANTGNCSYTTTNMRASEQRCLQRIASRLNMSTSRIRVSCAQPQVGHTYGGAMGPAQIMPCTWEENKDQIGSVLGQDPDAVSPFDSTSSYVASGVVLNAFANSRQCSSYIASGPLQSQSYRRVACAAAGYAGGYSRQTRDPASGNCIANKAILVQSGQEIPTDRGSQCI